MERSTAARTNSYQMPYQSHPTLNATKMHFEQTLHWQHYSAFLTILKAESCVYLQQFYSNRFRV